MSRFLKFVLACLGFGVLGLVVGFLAVFYLAENQSFNATLFNMYVYIAGGVGVLVGAIFLGLKLADDKDGEFLKSSGKKKKSTDKPTEQYFDGRWLTQKEMDKKYCGCTWANLHEQESGIPLRAELLGGQLRINMLQNEWQTLIIGTTGSGKTSAIIIPTIQILSSTKNKPTLVINDPKGELWTKNVHKLKQEGYDIQVFNVRSPFGSTRWNPMEPAFLDFQRAHNLRQEVRVHRGDNPADTPGLKIISNTYNTEWFEFEKVAFPTREALEIELKARAQQLENNAHETLDDLANVLCPESPNDNDPQWQRGARDFINGVMLAMLEDSLDPRLGMTKERFNLFNLYNICGIRDSGKDQYASLKKYFNNRDKLSPALKKASPIINNAETTTNGYMGIVAQSLSAFADDGLCYLTSGSELVLDNIVDKPTALFIKVPDEKTNKHFIATMLILQLYKTLVAVANKHDPANQKLPRHVYMILDEFGNFPRFPGLNNIITVARSRRIVMIMALQDYNQLNQIYGDQIAATVRSNCNIQIYLGTADAATKKEFSERCGQTVVEVESKSENKGKGKDSSSSTTTSKQKVSRALITPEELSLLKRGEMIISLYSESPIRTHFTPYFDAKGFYDTTEVEEPYIPSKYFDKANVHYDIQKRNDIVYKNDFDDDSDFDF